MMLVRLLLLAASVVAIPDPNDPLLLEYRWLLLVLVLDFDYNFCSDYYYDLYYGDYDDDTDYKAPGEKFTFAHIFVAFVSHMFVYLCHIYLCICVNICISAYMCICERKNRVTPSAKKKLPLQRPFHTFVHMYLCSHLYFCICYFARVELKKSCLPQRRLTRPHPGPSALRSQTAGWIRTPRSW